MFEILEQYTISDHFFINESDKLIDTSAKVPSKPGVYYILKLAKGKIDLVYIGSAGILNQNGSYNKLLLKAELSGKVPGILWQQELSEKMKAESIDALDVYWFATVDKNHNDIPGYVAAIMIQTYFDMHGQLPEWNQTF